MKKFILALTLSLLFSTSSFAQNYTATQGTGTTFGSKLVSAVNYPQFVVCDPTTPAQCAAVDASGRLSIIPNTAMNIAQINGVTPLMGNGVTGTGSQRVTIASDNTAFSVNAIQSGTWTVQPGNTANTTPWLASISQGGNTAIVKAGNTFAGTEQAVGVAVTNTLTAVTPGDGITTTIYGTAPASPVIGVPLLWNGTTYDRLKSSGTGFAAVNPGTAANWGVGATAAAVPANAMYNGALDAVGGTNLIGIAADPCQSTVKTTLPITLATAAVKVIATGVSSKKIYVCQINLNNNAADTVAIFEATTATTCATSPVAVIGAGTSVATAGTGYNFGATGGISLGNGANQVLVTTVNNNDLCIAQSAATQLSGSITYVTR